MTVIQYGQSGGWVEVLLVDILINDAAGFYNSAVVNLTKVGHCMGFSQSIQNMPNNDASQNCGGIFTIKSSGATITPPTSLSSIIVQVQKTASTSGAQTITAIVCLFMQP